MIFKRIIFLPLFLFFAQLTFAQNKPGIKSWVDRDQSHIGEPFILTIEAKLPRPGTISFPKIDSIPHFEIVEPPVIDSVISGDSITIKGVYKLISFDSGHWVIPSFVLAPKIKSDTIPIDIVFTKNFDPNQDYHDIKDILEVKTGKEKNWWPYIAGSVVLLALLIYLLLKRKTPPTARPAELPVNAYEEAKKQLVQLEKEKPETKQYYTRLIDIFRVYVYRKKDIRSLQKTTDDLVIQLKSLDMGKEKFDRLSQSLRLSDFVKFAKYQPSENDRRMVFDVISESIEEIERMS